MDQTTNMLDLDAVKLIVENILTDRLGAWGFSHADIEEKFDEEGHSTLHIRSVFDPEIALFTGEQSIRAIHDVRMALLRQGEERFPYLLHTFPHSPAA